MHGQNHIKVVLLLWFSPVSYRSTSVSYTVLRHGGLVLYKRPMNGGGTKTLSLTQPQALKTRKAMYVHRNIVWRSSVTRVAMEMKQGELSVSWSNKIIFKFAQKCFMANLCRRNNESYSGFH